MVRNRFPANAACTMAPRQIEAGVEFWEIQMDFRPEGVTLYKVMRSADL
jgi:hypothetical protein